MKELKYNIQCLIRKKELYFAIIGILLINLIHILLVIHYNYNSNLFYENGYTAEYLSILYNANVSFSSITIIILPILSSTIISDISFNEKKWKLDNILTPRLNKKRIIITRFFLTIAIVFIINFIAFLINYITLLYMYGSGNNLTYSIDPIFYINSSTKPFLDSLRVSNIKLFVILISAHVSLLISLLSGLSYAISFFVKQKIMIYVFPFILIILTEVIFPFFNLYSYSIVGQLQPSSDFSISNAIIMYGILLITSISVLHINNIKKDNI